MLYTAHFVMELLGCAMVMIIIHPLVYMYMYSCTVSVLLPETISRLISGIYLSEVMTVIHIM